MMMRAVRLETVHGPQMTTSYHRSSVWEGWDWGAPDLMSRDARAWGGPVQ